MKSIKTHLTVTLLLCILLPSGLISATAFWFIFDTIKQERIQDVSQIAEARHQSLHEQLFEDNHRAQELLKTVIAECRGSDVGINVCAKPKLNEFFSINGTVGMSLHSGIEPDLTIGKEAILINTLRQPFLPKQLAIISKSSQNNTPLFSFIARNAASGFSLVITYHGLALQAIFLQPDALGKSGETFLADNQGFFITRPRYDSQQGVIKPISVQPMQSCLHNHNGEMLDFDYRNVPIIHGFKFIPEIGGGCIMAHIDQKEAFMPLLRLLILLIAIIVILIFSAWIIAKTISKNMTQPISKLAEVAKALEQENFIPQTIHTKYQEIEELSLIFNSMSESLKQTLSKLKNAGYDLEQKVIERTAQLERRRRKYHAVIETSADGFWRVNSTGHLQEVNPTYCRFSGYSEQELLSMQVSDLEVLEKPGETAVHLQKIIQQGWDIFETQHRRKDGSVWDAEVNTSFVDAEGGYFVSFLRDISERKLLEISIKENEILLHNIMDASPAAIHMKDLSGCYVHINQCYTKTLQLSKEAILGKTDEQLFPFEIAQGFRTNDLAVIESGTALETEEIALHADGSYHTYISIKVPLRSISGEIYATCGVSTDITERKLHEKEIQCLSDSALNKAKLEAERASQVKSDFLASMSHELFTPMNAVLGFAQILQYEELTFEQQTYVDLILTSGHHLLDLIKEVLDFSIIESEKIDLNLENVALQCLVENCMTAMQPLVLEKSIHIVDDLSSASDVAVIADAVRLKQVLLNLISNAIKYNRQKGSIHLSCKTIAPNVLRINIADTGQGLAPDQIFAL
jgi:PAS domain S-box-containing protein